MRLKYYSELDGVRGVAALMVMFYHFFIENSYSGSLGELLSKICIFGQTGVDLFFVLSGFLITRILIETKDSKGFFSNFYMRRSLRIFPLYYFTLILYYFIIPLSRDYPLAGFSQQVYYWIYLQNFAMTFNWDAIGPEHFWSLGVEEHFYLFWPLVVYLLNRHKLIVAIVALIFISLVTRIAMTVQGYEVFYFTFTRFDSLTIGAVLSLMELKGVLKKENSLMFLGAMLVFILPVVIMWLSFSGDGLGVIQVIKPLMISIFYFLFLGYLTSSSESSPLRNLFKASLLSYTGRVSYGLYVYHPFVFFYLSGYTKTGFLILDFFYNLLASYLVATLSYYFFEKKVLKFKSYFEYRKNDEKDVLLKTS